jgi:HKD family nuclease
LLGLRVARGVVGDAFGTTEPAAIRKLRLGGSEVRVSVEAGIFHSKVYLMPYNGTLAAFVGSSNLTQGGLRSNEEANLVLRGPKDEAPIPELLNYYRELWEVASVPIDDEWNEGVRRKVLATPEV